MTNDETLEALLQVAKDRLQVMDQLKKVRKQKYRSVGRNLIEMNVDSRKRIQEALLKQSDQRCSRMYEEINRKRIRSDLPELVNPYTTE